MKKVIFAALAALVVLAGKASAAGTYYFTPDAVTTVENISASGVAIGKGKTAATAALDVVGAAKVSGNLQAGSLTGTISTSNISGILPATKGGTGADLSASAAGSLPYFSATGVQSAAGPGSSNQLLQSNGTSAPTWTGSPTILGSNITAIPAANIANGSLGVGVLASGLQSKSKAALLADTPSAAGQAWYCSDCSLTAVAVSTATTPGGVSDIKDRTAVVQ